MASTLYPARDYVMIEMEEKKYAGNLHIPDSAKDAPVSGTVTAVGPGTPEDGPLLTKVGDKVIFAKYSGADLEWEGKQLLLIRESEIICYIKQEG